MIVSLPIFSVEEESQQKPLGDEDWFVLFTIWKISTSRQAADAVRARVDVKYLLGLEIGDPDFDFTVLTEFRTRLIEHQAEHRLFDLLIAKLNEQGYLKKRGIQRTDSTHVLAAVHRSHRVELLPET